MTPAHMAALQNGTLFRLNDAVTRSKFEDNLKNSEFYTNALKILANVQDPGYAIKVLRHIGRESGVKDIDEVLPAPVPADANPPQAPGMPAQPGQQAPASAPDFDTMLRQAREEGVMHAAA